MIPIYYINMATRPDRRAFMEAQFTRLGLAAERIDAVSVFALTIAERTAAAVRAGPLACAMSHEKIWALMLERQQPRALILEDDAVLSNSLRAFLAGLRDDDGDLIRIETIPRPSRILPRERMVTPDIALHVSRSTELGSAGYLITARGARTMLEIGQQRQIPLDIALYCPFLAAGRRLGHKVSNPALCIQLTATPDSTSPLAKSDLYVEPLEPITRPKRRFPRLQRFAEKMALDVPKTWDHLINLPRGLKPEVILFRAG